MTTIRLLYDLQEIDTELAKARAQIAALEAKVGNESPLAAPRAAVEAATRGVVQARSAQRDQEMTVDSLRSKIKASETQQFSGKVTSPRELEAMRQDSTALKTQAEKGDEQSLALMEKVEAAQGALRAAQEALAKAEAEWRRGQDDAKAQVARLKAGLGPLEVRRRDAVTRVPPANLTTYDRIRTTKGGVAVTRLTGGVCGACRMSPTATTLQQARSGQGTALCPNCGRILFVG